MIDLCKCKPPLYLAILILTCLFFVSCLTPMAAQTRSLNGLVELVPIDVDPKQPERKNFGSLKLLSAFQLQSKDKRFGGLSGLAIGTDGKLYAVSDNGYWLSARMEIDSTGALLDLADWRIAPILTSTKTPVAGSLRDAEALARERDGSFLVRS